jgi:Flp pilus assembly pilin Flp
MFSMLTKIWRNETKFTAVECGIMASLGVIYIEKLLTNALVPLPSRRPGKEALTNALIEVVAKLAVGAIMFVILRSLWRAEGGFSAIEYGLIAACGLIAVGQLISKL